MAKAVKKAGKSRSTASKVLRAVASLLPHKNATKKAKANSPEKTKSTSKTKSATKSSKQRGILTKTNSSKITSSKSGKTASDNKSKAKKTQSYAETLRGMAEQKRLTAKAGNDPAHAPGHRKIKIQGLKKTGPKGKSNNDSVMIANSKADRIHQTESEQRRLIPGASIERKGRR